MIVSPKIAVTQTAFENGDLSYNLDVMERLVRECKEKDPETNLIVFPELSSTGYFLSLRIKELAEFQEGPIFERMRNVAVQNEIYIVYGYVEKDKQNKIYNSIQMIDPKGNSVANYRKIHLTPLEKGLFSPGSNLILVQTDLGNIGLMICWDLAFPELSRALALKGADLLLAPSAWEAPYDAPFLRFGLARAIDNTVYVATCNHIGKSDDLHFFGKSTIYGPDGSTIKMVEEEVEQIHITSLNYEWRDKLRKTFYTMLEDRIPEVY